MKNDIISSAIFGAILFAFGWFAWGPREAVGLGVMGAVCCYGYRRPSGWAVLGAFSVMVLALAGCASQPAANGDKHITVKADRVAQCEQQGGCALFTQAEVLGMLNEAVEAGAAAAAADLDSHGCKRGSL